MKKVYAYIIIICACLLTACSSGEAGYRIGVSQCSEGRWRNKVNQEMLAAQHLYERDVKICIANSYDDAARQARQIDSLATTGIDLLVVAPNEDSKAINDAIGRVRRQGLPVIFFDRKTSMTDYTAFIGGNNTEAGEVVGRYAATLGQRILEVTGSMSSSPAQERHKGFEQAMARHRGLDYVCEVSDWTAEGCRQSVSRQLEAGFRPDVIFCHNDAQTVGARKAVEAAGLAGTVKLLGIDGMPDEGLLYMQQGRLNGTYVYPTHGEKIVRLALDILTGRPYKRDNALTSIMVTPEEIDLVALNAKELTAQNKDLITIHQRLERTFSLYDTQQKVLWTLAVTCLVMVMAVVAIWRAYRQTRKAVRQRQAMNEEQTLFYTDANRRKVTEILSTPQEHLPQPQSQDVLFAERLNEAIRKNMSNPNLKMDELGEELGLRRVQLYRRVKALTGMSPVELLRQMRLQQAYVLLGSTTKTVAEIAFEVGFNTPGYFSKCFKEQYGKLPMDLRDSATKDT